MQHNTLSKHNQKLPFTRYDFGWVLLCIGMAIGAGTVLMPVQIGLKGIWVFITAAIIAYPATWVVQDIYLKTLSEKLEVINLQLAKRSITKVKTIRWILISLCAVIVIIFIVLASMSSSYLDWNYNDPELAVAGTIMHGFEFLFVRIAPITFLASVVGIVATYKKR